jgi:hypothetical protein
MLDALAEAAFIRLPLLRPVAAMTPGRRHCTPSSRNQHPHSLAFNKMGEKGDPLAMLHPLLVILPIVPGHIVGPIVFHFHLGVHPL